MMGLAGSFASRVWKVEVTRGAVSGACKGGGSGSPSGLSPMKIRSGCRLAAVWVAGLRSLQCGPNRLPVAHLPDEDHVGVLPSDVPQGRGEVGGVDTHLALVDDRQPVRVEDLDGIFNRHDMAAARGVDVVDHRRR